MIERILIPCEKRCRFSESGPCDLNSLWLAVVWVLIFSGAVFPVHGASPQEVATAIRKSIPLLERAAVGTTSHRKCFTCHGHALPVFVMVEAEQRGFHVDLDNLKDQLDHTAAEIQSAKPLFSEGRAKNGGYTRVGYALWTLDVGGRNSDEFTSAAVDYLLHDPSGSFWRASANRPPGEGSPFATSYAAMRGMRKYAIRRHSASIEARSKRVLSWLEQTPARDTEDLVFRLLGLHEVNAGIPWRDEAANHLLEKQRKSGGWAQKEGMQSDVYATGTALYALYRTGAVLVKDPEYQNGVDFLLSAQHSDGSWHVPSRSEPIQKYYESGYPHQDDQFISMTAGGWATLALLFTVDREEGTGSGGSEIKEQ